MKQIIRILFPFEKSKGVPRLIYTVTIILLTGISFFSIASYGYSIRGGDCYARLAQVQKFNQNSLLSEITSTSVFDAEAEAKIREQTRINNAIWRDEAARCQKMSEGDMPYLLGISTVLTILSFYILQFLFFNLFNKK